MNTAARNLHSLLGSRICHDLISPLGAIGNGVELLSMSGISGAPEIALISESVDSANARIKFFRVAFGAASPDQLVGRAEILSILDGLTKGGRLVIEWQPRHDIDRAEAKLLFLMLLCFETAMPWGGRLMVIATGDTWSLRGSAERLKIDEGLWSVLEDIAAAPDELTSATVHFPLAADVAMGLARQIRVAISDGSIEARL